MSDSVFQIGVSIIGTLLLIIGESIRRQLVHVTASLEVVKEWKAAQSEKVVQLENRVQRIERGIRAL